MPNFAVYSVDPNQLQTLIFGSDGTNAVPISTDSTGRINIGDIGTVTALEAATIVGGTLNAVEAATIVGGTLNAVEAVTIVGGNVSVTITGGTVSASLSGGTIDALLAGTVSATILGGTLNAVEAATIVGGTIDALLAGTVSATILGGTITTISQNNFNQFSLLGATVSTTTYSPIPSASLNQMTYPYKVYSYFVNNNAGAETITARVELSSDGTNWVIDQTSTNLTSGAMLLTPVKFAKYSRLSLAVLSGSATVDVYLDAQV